MTAPGLTASLGIDAGHDALLPLLGGSAVFALTSDSADPATAPTEVSVDGYTRQPFGWSNVGTGRWRNDTEASWSLPTGTEVGGVAILDDAYDGFASPLAWIELPTPFVADSDQVFRIPALGILIQGYTRG